MTNSGLSALYDALTQDPGSHLEDEILAELATSEAAGEDIDTLYLAEIGHIEACVDCAEAYDDLVKMMLSAVNDMVDGAAAVSPLEVYTALLEGEVSNQIGTFPQLLATIHNVVAGLPVHFTKLPESELEIGPNLIGEILTDSSQSPQEISQIKTAIVIGMQRTLSAVSIYLTEVAEEAWGRTVGLKQDLQGIWQSIQLFPLQEAAVPTLDGRETGQRWHLFSQQIGNPVPFNVDAWAKRLTPLACRVRVQINQPGLLDISGIPVQFCYSDKTLTTETDSSGCAIFESVPVAIVQDVEIRFQG